MTLGASTGTLGNPPDATVTITTLAGTTSQQPFVISDPPFEVEEGSQFGVSSLSAYTISVLTNATRGPTSVTVQLVGNYPAGTTVTAGSVATSATAPYLASFSLTSTLPTAPAALAAPVSFVTRTPVAVASPIFVTATE